MQKGKKKGIKTIERVCVSLPIGLSKKVLDSGYCVSEVCTEALNKKIQEKEHDGI